MAQVHMSDEELARDVHASDPPHRRVSEVLALIPKDSGATMDSDFARDVQAAIDSHREPLDPPSWD